MGTPRLKTPLKLAQAVKTIFWGAPYYRKSFKSLRLKLYALNLKL